MSLESRYNNIISDLISLMQQALIRYIANKDVDLIKFGQYFSSLFNRATKLQQQFLDNQKKFSKNVQKIAGFYLQFQKSNNFYLNTDKQNFRENSNKKIIDGKGYEKKASKKQLIVKSPQRSITNSGSTSKIQTKCWKRTIQRNISPKLSSTKQTINTLQQHKQYKVESSLNNLKKRNSFVIEFSKGGRPKTCLVKSDKKRSQSPSVSQKTSEKKHNKSVTLDPGFEGKVYYLSNINSPHPQSDRIIAYSSPVSSRDNYIVSFQSEEKIKKAKQRQQQKQRLYSDLKNQKYKDIQLQVNQQIFSNQKSSLMNTRGNSVKNYKQRWSYKVNQLL